MRVSNILLVLVSSVTSGGALAVTLPKGDLPSLIVGLKGGSTASHTTVEKTTNGTLSTGTGSGSGNNATSTAFSFAVPTSTATSMDVSETMSTETEIASASASTGAGAGVQDSTEGSSSSSSTISSSSSSIEQQILRSLSEHQELMEKTSTSTSTSTSQEEKNPKTGLKVLFLSADTGGGHRASAESLANQFQKHYPGTTYDLLDVWTPTKVYPYTTLVKSYKHLSAHPRQWKLLYYISNTRPYEIMTDVHSKATCYDKIKKQMEEYDPDVVVSVHPTMNNLPEKITREIATVRGKEVPFFTVVTDFGSGHCTWFQKDVDKMYIASDKIHTLAKKRGRVTDDQLEMYGLPIRDAFGVQADKMVDRTSGSGKDYRKEMKARLGIDPEKKVVLAMGGGEGVGSLSKITEKLHLEMKARGIDATILVVCGRNEKLKNEINAKDWTTTSIVPITTPKKKGKVLPKLKKVLGTLKLKLGKKKTVPLQTDDNDNKELVVGDVDVIGLGFVDNMAEYMVAADVLVSKAGPGTIAEAASVGLPVMITSFLPGQEAGNVDIVLDGKFGAFCKKPTKIAKIVTSWLTNDDKLDALSRNSAKVGNPHAASNIVKDIGRMTLETMENNIAGPGPGASPGAGAGGK